MIKDLAAGFSLVFLLLGMACEGVTEAQRIIDQAMVTHGSAQLQQQELLFDFRNKHYTYPVGIMTIFIPVLLLIVRGRYRIF